MAPKPESASPNKKPSLHRGHRKRMKERYREHGQEVFDDHQLLELLLFYAIPQGDVNPLSHKLLDQFYSLDQLLSAPLPALIQVDGVGEHTAILLHLVRDVAFRCQLSRNSRIEILAETQDAADYLAPYFEGANQELFYIVCLDQKYKVLRVERLAKGSFNSVSADNRQLLSVVLACNASQVILAHNHTSGIALPSEADIVATKSIRQALKGIEVKLLDHLIFSDGDYTSLRASGRLYGFL